ncbi:YeeE/YedE family protein [Aliagarivorans marinus]|uniref:YeeE/YedE family protein n=1 Tax=Aliagarivorans marinus TaxID=561965 RepID=UPI000429820B|nr:YeeE/YedE thiosulfate transporter family protein [Aliagarivorans marinus]
MTLNSILPALLGGALLGLSAAALLLFTGRIAGISGIVASLLNKGSLSGPWQLWFAGGMLLGGGLAVLAGVPLPTVAVPLPVAVIAGVLVGIGSRMANGCTSGHGICGIGRLSLRSIVATAVFMLCAVITATLIH